MDQFTPKSSFIEKAEYDESQRIMTLTFKTGSQTRYLYVFPATWLSFKQSPDHSSYYSRAIKGKLMSVPLIKKTIGRVKSSPLHQKHLKKGLNNGKRNPSAGNDKGLNGGRIAGTFNRLADAVKRKGINTGLIG